ncbi:MAG: mitochondrial ribosomal subunit protein-domain-containing protein [Piptocephalis tieghemiana]|nr:MAG: mitochondrial ribosomal subunit protein-domain-containing protein [Piptocephalis tieghemiana]
MYNLVETHDTEGSDMHTLGQIVMDQVDEILRYEELEVKELPILRQFAQTYTPPKESAILRLRTIDYPAEDHPLQHKVVLQVSPSKLGLTPTQLHKFLLLAGPRYDPAREELKISSERYQNRTLNLKWASDALDRLIAEAKNPKETFADVPLTFPHYKPKRTFPFPEAWRMSTEEAMKLKEAWRAKDLEAKARAEESDGPMVMMEEKIKMDSPLAKEGAPLTPNTSSPPRSS